MVLAGRGRAFCAGHDLKEPEPVETPVQTRLRLEAIQEVTRLIRRFPGPVVAAVHGYALGAGCEFALACDVVVADRGRAVRVPRGRRRAERDRRHLAAAADAGRLGQGQGAAAAR